MGGVGIGGHGFTTAREDGFFTTATMFGIIVRERGFFGTVVHQVGYSNISNRYLIYIGNDKTFSYILNFFHFVFMYDAK